MVSFRVDYLKGIYLFDFVDHNRPKYRQVSVTWYPSMPSHCPLALVRLASPENFSLRLNFCTQYPYGTWQTYLTDATLPRAFLPSCPLSLSCIDSCNSTTIIFVSLPLVTFTSLDLVLRFERILSMRHWRHIHSFDNDNVSKIIDFHISGPFIPPRFDSDQP